MVEKLLFLLMMVLSFAGGEELIMVDLLRDLKFLFFEAFIVVFTLGDKTLKSDILN